MTVQSINDFNAVVGAGATSGATVAKLVKAWESKGTQRALRGSGLGLMAVTLAACGGSGDTATDGGTDGGTTPPPVTPVVSLATMAASDALPTEYNVAIASADLGTVSLALVENISGEIDGAANAAEFLAALAAGSITVTYSIADTIENADGVLIDGVVNLTLAVAGETAGADTQDATLTASGSGTVSLVFADQEDTVVLTADSTLDGFTTLSVVSGTVDVTAADLGGIDVITVASAVILTAEQFLALDGVAVTSADGAIRIALSTVEEAADVLAAAALLAGVDADQIEFVVAEGGNVTVAELADLNADLDTAVAVAGAESALPLAIEGVLAAEEAQADFVSVAAANEDVFAALAQPANLTEVSFAEAQTAIDLALNGDGGALDTLQGFTANGVSVDVTDRTDAQIAADVSAVREVLAENTASAEDAAAASRAALIEAAGLAAANRVDALVDAEAAVLAAADGVDLALAAEAAAAGEFLVPIGPDGIYANDVPTFVGVTRIVYDGTEIAFLNGDGVFTYTAAVDLVDGSYVIDGVPVEVDLLDAYIAAAQDAVDAVAAYDAAVDAEAALQVLVDELPQSADVYKADVDALDEANGISDSFEDALSAWQDLVALDAQAEDLVTGLSEAVEAIEGPLSSDVADVIEGLNIDVIGYTGVNGDPDTDAQLLIFDADAGLALDFDDGVATGVVDYIAFGDAYTFVAVDAADDVVLDAVGSVSTLEIFAQEDDTGVTLFIEGIASAGTGSSGADLTQIRLEGTTLDELSFNDVTGILSGQDILNLEQNVI